MGMIVTLKDVARHARVSVTSASYALNGTGTISAATRQRILETAEKLNYHPNAFARNLKKQKTSTIGVFISKKFPIVVLDRNLKRNNFILNSPSNLTSP